MIYILESISSCSSLLGNLVFAGKYLTLPAITPAPAIAAIAVV
jgi:hypothetical protein